MPTDWILRVKGGINFERGRPDGVWGIKQRERSFISGAQDGDTLWFVGKHQKLLGMGKFRRIYRPELQPLLPIDRDAEYYGFGDFNVLVYYDEFYDCRKTNLKLLITGQCSIRTGQQKNTSFPGGLRKLGDSIKMFANIEKC